MAQVQPLKLIPEEIKPSAAQANETDNRSTNAQGNRDSEVTSTTSPQTHRFDPDFTRTVINATGPKASPRMRKVMASLIQHVHDFARENEITVDEWMAGVEMVTAPQQKSWGRPYTFATVPIRPTPTDQPSRSHVHRRLQ